MKRGLVTLALSLALVGCATWRSPSPSPVLDTAQIERLWQQQRSQVEQIHGFKLQGRLAEVRGRSAALNWQQTRQYFSLQLRGPLGVGAMALSGTPDAVTVRNKDGTQFSDDPQAWMQTHLGWHLPLAELRAWVLGLPADAPIEQLILNDQGRILQLQQGGWTLRYDTYQQVGDYTLPHHLEAHSADTHLRLIVDRWTAIDAAPVAVQPERDPL